MKQLITNRIFIISILLVSTFSETRAQYSATIYKPKDYSSTNPYLAQNIPDKATLNLYILTGSATYIIFPEIDSNFNLATDPHGDTVIPESGTLNTIKINLPGLWIFEYISSGKVKTTSIQVSYLSDIQDQTIGSVTFGKYPYFIWIPQSNSATVNVGKNFGYSKWKGISETVYVGDYTDSVRVFNRGIYVGRFNDDTGYWTNDTISIIEKPTLNNTAKTLNFPTTTGITYKLMKAGSISDHDTIWTETQNFVGDGNSKNITLTDGNYKLTMTLGIHTAVYPYGYFSVGTTTAIENATEENIHYRLTDDNVLFENEVNFEFYSLQGQLLQQGQGSSFKLCRQAGIFKATDKNGNVLTEKILLK